MLASEMRVPTEILQSEIEPSHHWRETEVESQMGIPRNMREGPCNTPVRQLWTTIKTDEGRQGS